MTPMNETDETSTTGEPEHGDPLHLARAIRPQAFGSTRASEIRDPIMEPRWQGIRVIAAVQGKETLFLDDGVEIEGPDQISGALIKTVGVTTDGAVLDGYLTKLVAASEDDGQPVLETDLEKIPSVTRSFMIGTRRDRRAEALQQLAEEEAARTFAEDDPVNFVITDLLWLDGEWLLDIPLLERKRLLGSIVTGSDLIRAGAYVRPPLGTWIGSWRAQGFNGITLKEANSRYRPGTKAADWATSSMPRR